MFTNVADETVLDVATADGRKLACLEVGDPAGPLVIHNHGGPSSRLEILLFAEAAAGNGIRLVGVDRPGLGQSSPQKTRTYSGWADDLIVIADALGYREFGVTGWSEGGPWAIAAAAYIDPDRLRHVSSIASGSYGAFGDNSAGQYLSRIDALGGKLALRFTPGFRLMYAGLGFTAKRFPSAFVKQVRGTVNAYDQEILARPDVVQDFAASCAECFAHGSDGLVSDAELLYGVGLSTSPRSTGESICGRDWTTGSSRTPSTRPSRGRCRVRSGIPSMAPVISSPSARQLRYSPSRLRNYALDPAIASPVQPLAAVAN